MKSFMNLAAFLPLLAAANPIFSLETIHQGVAPLLSSSNADEIPDSYIVVFKDHVSHGGAAAHHSWVQELHSGAESARHELRKRGQIPLIGNVFDGFKHTYNIAGQFLGYSGHFDEDVVEMIRRNPDVRSSVP